VGKLTYAREIDSPSCRKEGVACARNYAQLCITFHDSAGAVAYAYSYVFFTSTVVYALIAGTPNYKDMTKVFGAWMTVHGLIMLAGGLAFGLAVARAGVLPRWTGIVLMAGVILVVAGTGLPNLARTVAAAVPDAAFIGMGLALLRGRLKPYGQQGHATVEHPHHAR
jgi:hypothetical protein